MHCTVLLWPQPPRWASASHATRGNRGNSTCRRGRSNKWSRGCGRWGSAGGRVGVGNALGLIGGQGRGFRAIAGVRVCCSCHDSDEFPGLVSINVVRWTINQCQQQQQQLLDSCNPELKQHRQHQVSPFFKSKCVSMHIQTVEQSEKDQLLAVLLYEIWHRNRDAYNNNHNQDAADNSSHIQPGTDAYKFLLLQTPVSQGLTVQYQCRHRANQWE